MLHTIQQLKADNIWKQKMMKTSYHDIKNRLKNTNSYQLFIAVTYIL